jgi:hypothetical protein
MPGFSAGHTLALKETEKYMKLLTQALAVAALTLITTTFASGQFTSAPPRNGACFFNDYSYRGESFCVIAGQNAASVPSNFNDRIRSIRVYGGTQVQYFNDSNFNGASGATSRDISDLRRLSVPDARNKNWSGRISSVRIAGSGLGRYGDDRGWNQKNNRNRKHDDADRSDDRGSWNQGQDRNHDNNGDRDRHDANGSQNNDQARVSCSSGLSSNREWCRTAVRVNSVRLINETGQNRCELNRTFGIDEGRLWTARGCSGNFEFR